MEDSHMLSQKWVDFTDSDSSEELSSQKSSSREDLRENSAENKPPPGHVQIQPMKSYVPSQQQLQEELSKLNHLKEEKVEQVWLDIFSQNEEYLKKEMEQVGKKAKKGGNIVFVFPTHLKEKYEAKVFISIAYDWIEKGYDSNFHLKATIAQRNFDIGRFASSKAIQKDTAHHRQEKSGFIKEKKKYVDKRTGKPPEGHKIEESHREKREKEETDHKVQNEGCRRNSWGNHRRGEKEENEKNVQERVYQTNAKSISQSTEGENSWKIIKHKQHKQHKEQAKVEEVKQVEIVEAHKKRKDSQSFKNNNPFEVFEDN